MVEALDGVGAVEMVRFAGVFLSDGRASNGTQVLAKESVATMTEPLVDVPTEFAAQRWCVGAGWTRTDTHGGLQVAVRQHTSLSFLASGEVLVLERLASHNEVPNISQIGGRLPVHATSPGLLMLAYSDSAFQETFLARPLRRYTDRTVTSPAELRTILAEVRARRCAVAEGTVNPIGGGVATAIRDAAGNVVAALSITYGLDEHVAQSVLPALIATARSISRAVSAQPQRSHGS